MKNEPVREVFQGLPDDRQVCEMILRLPGPYHEMAWVMVETGIKADTLVRLPVMAFSAAKKVLTVEEGASVRRFVLSDGLTAALADHLDRVRPVYEGQGRGFLQLLRSRHAERPVRFSESLLFPAWTVAGYGHATGNLAIPPAWLVAALAEAARDVGFEGRIHSNSLRHACIARWLARGLEVSEIHHRLGHRDMLTTLLLTQALQHGGLSFTSAA